MCGRYVLREVIKLREKLEQLRTRRLNLELRPRFNVAPTQTMPVVLGNDPPVEAQLRWGPLYPLQPGAPTLLVNARSETVATKATFREALQERRCVVPADGFFEWHRQPRTKTPYLFERRDQELFWIAGIHEHATPVTPASFLVLTTGPNELMAPIHDRMPVIFDDGAAAEWLAPGRISAARVAQLCIPYPAAQMTTRPVNPVVNNARNDTPECVAAAPAPPSPDEFRLE